jgi:murein DD-endopeptidase MepM/ murein hydrolase activator NlpD
MPVLPLHNAYIKSAYGDYLHERGRLDGYKHAGIDLYSSNPTVYAITKGIVYAVKPGIEKTGYGGYGPYIVVIQDESDRFQWYAHLSKTLVSEGEEVNEGQKIGEIEDGLHVHLEIRREPFPSLGNFPFTITLDPVNYIEGKEKTYKKLVQRNTGYPLYLKGYVMAKEHLEDALKIEEKTKPARSQTTQPEKIPPWLLVMIGVGVGIFLLNR